MNYLTYKVFHLQSQNNRNYFPTQTNQSKIDYLKIKYRCGILQIISLVALEHKSNPKVIDHSQNSINYFHQNLIIVYKKHTTGTLSFHQSKINNNIKVQHRYRNQVTQWIMHSGFTVSAFSSNTSMHSWMIITFLHCRVEKWCVF